MTRSRRSGFPRLYAAASLKLASGDDGGDRASRFPRLYAAASLKLAALLDECWARIAVFRGFMPRPH